MSNAGQGCLYCLLSRRSFVRQRRRRRRRHGRACFNWWSWTVPGVNYYIPAHERYLSSLNVPFTLLWNLRQLYSISNVEQNLKYLPTHFLLNWRFMSRYLLGYFYYYMQFQTKMLTKTVNESIWNFLTNRDLLDECVTTSTSVRTASSVGRFYATVRRSGVDE